MAKRVTEKEKIKMWQLYQECGNISKVAEKVKRNRGTVSRYIHEYEAATRATAYVLGIS